MAAPAGETDEDLGMVPGEQAFSAAADRVAATVVAGPRPSEDVLLQLYGLYKQATAGNCPDAAPWFWRLQERRKWSAWARLSGTSAEAAMAEYTRVANRCLGAHQDAGGGGGGGGGGGSGGAARGAKGGGLGGAVVSRPAYGPDGGGAGPCASLAARAAVGSGCSGVPGEPGTAAAAAAEHLRELAASGDEVALAAALDAPGSNANAADPESGCAALHFAADRGHLGAARLLVSRGADINARDGEGQTALHYAALCGHREVYEALLAAGADPEIADADGSLPRHVVSWAE